MEPSREAAKVFDSLRLLEALIELVCKGGYALGDQLVGGVLCLAIVNVDVGVVSLR